MPEEAKTGMTNEQLLEVIKALREPTQEEKEAKEQKLAAKAARKASWVKEREEHERQLNFKYKWCIDGTKHRKGHPYEDQHTFGGQINNDGYFHPICIKCQTMFPKFKPNAQLLGGAELKDYGGLSVEIIEEWARESGVDPVPYRYEAKKKAV